MSDIFELFRKLSPPTTPTGPVDCIVACLGNPGPKYENTRHNVGFVTADYIAEKRGFRIDRLKFEALTGECIISGRRTLFLKPSTFMNLSGRSVAAAMNFYKLPPERVVVICDDISLAPGRIRIRPHGSAGGHNGLKNIIYLTNSDQFSRIRVGVGAKPSPEYDLVDWVLGVPSAEDRKLIEDAIRRVDESLDLVVAGEIEKAMNRYNKA